MTIPTPSSAEEERERIVGSLSEAQRSWMASAMPTWEGGPVFTYPPTNTHRVLMRLGLVDSSGMLSEPGVAVRAHLNNQGQG